MGGCAADRGAHRITVVLDHIDDRQLPKFGHVEALIDLALVRCAVAEIGDRHIVVAAIEIRESEAGAERNLCADDAVPAIEVLLLGEHVHRAALAARISTAPAGKLRHHTIRVHAHRQHVAVVAVPGDDLVALLHCHLHADDDSFLADVEMAEAADEAHAVELARLLLEAADQQHLAIGRQFVLAGELCRRWRINGRWKAWMRRFR